MTIVVFCPKCGSKLNAKDELLGQTRNCPKCDQPILIAPEPPKPPVEEITDDMLIPEFDPTAGITQPVIAGPSLGGAAVRKPAKIDFNNRYYVLSYDRIIAMLEPGKGWMLNVGSGFASAKKNTAAIPDQGTYAFVELLIGPTAQGNGPLGFEIYRIIARGALTSLYRDEAEILNKIEGPGGLTKAQKTLLLGYLQRHFMQSFFEPAPFLMDYLTNEDTTSSRIGKAGGT